MASGQDIISDHYTRLYDAGALSTRDLPLFDTLNRLSDRMRMRWKQDSGWLAFRGAAYCYDRLKEVPQRLLARWADARRKSGMLTVSELTEIAALNDTQLDSEDMAEGAWAIYGLNEWAWVQNRRCRDHWRLLTDLPAQLLDAVIGADGMALSDMPALREQQCIALLLAPQASGLQLRLQDFVGASLRVTLPKPEKIRDVQNGKSYDPMDYEPVFHYEYGDTSTRRKTREISPNGERSSG